MVAIIVVVAVVVGRVTLLKAMNAIVVMVGFVVMVMLMVVIVEVAKLKKTMIAQLVAFFEAIFSNGDSGFRCDGHGISMVTIVSMSRRVRSIVIVALLVMVRLMVAQMIFLIRI